MILLGPPQASKLFAGQANMHLLGSIASLPPLIVWSHPLRVKFDQQRSKPRDRVRYVLHSPADFIPATMYPPDLHVEMQFSALLLYWPPARFTGCVRVPESASLFVKHIHPSMVCTSDPKIKGYMLTQSIPRGSKSPRDQAWLEEHIVERHSNKG